MRLSDIIMGFINSSYIMIICALITGFLLFFVKNRLALLGNIIDDNISKRNIFYKALLFTAAAFIFWGYIFKMAFYTPYNTGVQGDNFNFLSNILTQPSYYLPHHLIFPWIGGQFIQFAKYIGVLNPQEHLFRFKAMAVAAIPVRIFSLIGLIYLYKIFKLFQFSLAKRILGVLFLATTFGYWLWSIQPNSLATALGLQCVALYYSIRMIKEENKSLLFLTPFFIVMVLYAHISSIVFVTTLALFLGTYLVVYYRKDMESIFVYMLTVLITGAFFLNLSSIYLRLNLGTLYGLKRYTEELIMAKAYGIFETGGMPWLFKKMANIAGQAITNMFGFWSPQNAFDYPLIFMIIAIVCALFIYIFLNFKSVYAVSNVRDRWAISMFLLTSTISFIFFTLKTSTMHYYVIALVPNAVLLLVLTFMTDQLHKKGCGVFLLFLIIPALFLYNGFSSMNVLKGLDYRESEVYQKFDFLYRKYPEEKIRFFETYNEYENLYREISGKRMYFFQDAITTDYVMGAFLSCFKPAFPNIEWVHNIRSEEILKKVKENRSKVIIGPRAFKKIKDELPDYVRVDVFKDTNRDINFYILHKINR